MKRQKFPILPLLLVISFAFVISSDVEISDISGILAAFGDFNSDKLTDVFVIANDLKRFQLYEQYSDKPYFRSRKGMSCVTDHKNEVIIGLVPGDFVGNSMMDVVILTRVRGANNDDKIFARLLRGNKSNVKCDEMASTIRVTFKSEPLALDYNGDMIIDLFGQSIDGKRYVWLGDPSGQFQQIPFELPSGNSTHQDIRRPNSNAFVDLNQDGVADIFVDGVRNMEYWFAKKEGYTELSKTIWHPVDYKYLGQSIFADFNIDSKIDHLLPACTSTDLINCTILYYHQPSSNWVPIANELFVKNSTYRLSFAEFQTHGNLTKFPISIRAGDVNADGFPDLVTILQVITVNGSYYETVLLLNTPESNALNRTFRAISQPSVGSKSTPLVATFFDLHEDGKIDILVNYRTKPGENSTENIKSKIYKNDLFGDGGFMKILVATSRCQKEKCEDPIDEKPIGGDNTALGTNQPGPTVCYKVDAAGGYSIQGCGSQLTQSAHFSLQMPYLVFGLGPMANFISDASVTVPTGNVTVILKRDLQEVVPDAQIVVIPSPLNFPSKWSIKLFYTPTGAIFLTLYVLLGTCLLVSVIVGILHWLEVREDLAEQREYASVWVDLRR